MDKLTARGLDAAGLPDGQYRLEVINGKGHAWVPAVDGVQSVVEGTRIDVDDTDPDNPVVSLATELFVLTYVVWDGSNWVTEIVADGGSHELMYMEVPIP